MKKKKEKKPLSRKFLKRAILVLVIVLHIGCTPFLIWVTTTVCPFYTFLFTPSE